MVSGVASSMMLKHSLVMGQVEYTTSIENT